MFDGIAEADRVVFRGLRFSFLCVDADVLCNQVILLKAGDNAFFVAHIVGGVVVTVYLLLMAFDE